jgi:chromosome segregation ATPase
MAAAEPPPRGRLGSETVRNLVIEGSYRISALDDVKASFNRLLDPLTSLLSTLERERAENAATRGALATLNSTHETLSRDFVQLERRSSEISIEHERLNSELAAARTQVQDSETHRRALTNELAGTRAATAMIETQLAATIDDIRNLTEGNQALADRLAISKDRVVALKKEAVRLSADLVLKQTEKEELQHAVDHAVVEKSAVARQLAETEASLSDATRRLEAAQSALQVAEQQHTKTAEELKKATTRLNREVGLWQKKLEALRETAASTEKALLTTRESLASRSSEAKIIEAKIREAHDLLATAERKAESSAALAAAAEQRVAKLKQVSETLTDRCATLAETLGTSEGWLLHVKEKTSALAEQLQHLQTEAAASSAKFEDDLVQLHATVEHERCERALAEGALARIRRDYSQLEARMAQHRLLRQNA